MHKIWFVCFIAVFACLINVSGTRAQHYRWHITHQEEIGKYQYYLGFLSSSGEVCTAIGNKIDLSITVRDPPEKLATRNRIIFLRSTDAGLSWVEQDPSLPTHSGDDQMNMYAVQQIDSLNATAVGDSGVIVRTFDGGETWVRQNLDSTWYVDAVDFFNASTGMVFTSNAAHASAIYTTTDSGNTWTKASFQPSNGCVLCKAWGGEKFSIISGFDGPIYKTKDNWNSVDSTKSFGDRLWLFGYKGQDTIVGFGTILADTFGTPTPSIYSTSTDGGNSWSPFVNMGPVVTLPRSMTQLDRSIVLVGGDNQGYLLQSTDHGMTWAVDTFDVDTTGANDPSIIYSVRSLVITPSGHTVGIITGNLFPGAGAFIRGDIVPSAVRGTDQIKEPELAYPNPASKELYIYSRPLGTKITILDFLGREVLSSTVPADRKLTLNISSLPSGMYFISDGTSREKLLKE